VRQIAALRLRRPLREICEVDDVVQGALLKAFKGLDRFEERSEGGFRSWLARCVESEIVDRLRSARALKHGEGRVRRFGDLERDSLSSAVFAGFGPTPSQVASARELGERIEAALLEMPSHHREVIILRQLCEMSYAEIAKAMGFAEEATARKVLSRALKRLREMVAVDE
jgi:RNA polymerase sigma-70 factor (ECF subfamily)